MEAVLPVDDVYYDPNIEVTGDVSQMTAEQYLSWVRHQASELPLYQRANVTSVPQRQSKYMPQVEEILRCPSGFLPDEEWEIDILHSFSELRLTLHRLSQSDSRRERKEVVPQMKDRHGWYKFCLGSVSSSSVATSSGLDEKGTSEATLKRKRELAEQLGIAMDATTEVVTDDMPDNDASSDNEEENDEDNDDNLEEYPDVNRGLAHYLPGAVLPEWTGSSGVSPSTSVLLQFDQVLTQKVFAYLVDWLDESPNLTSQCSKWIYGLLARLEKPVCQSTVAIIRQLYRRCCALRHHLNLDQPNFDADLAALNILISITGSYFGQGEEYVAFNQNHTEVIRDVDQLEDEEQEEEEGGENLWEAGDQWEVEDDNLEENNEREEEKDGGGSEKRMRLGGTSDPSAPQVGSAVDMELEEGECV